MIWTVQNHFGPIEGQGIKVNNFAKTKKFLIAKLCYSLNAQPKYLFLGLYLWYLWTT